MRNETINQQEQPTPPPTRVRWYPKDADGAVDGTVIDVTPNSYLVIPDDNLEGTARWNKKILRRFEIANRNEKNKHVV
jgi:hypothetical protein